MQVVKFDAEKKLGECLKKHWYDKSPYRCAYFKLAEASAFSSSPSQIEAFVKAIEGYFEDESALIYQCFDNDIFLVARYLTHKKLDLFLHAMRKQAEQTLDTKEGRRMTTYPAALLYDASVDWPKLRVICENKAEQQRVQLALKQSAITQKEEKLQAQHVLDVGADPDLIHTIKARRDLRKSFEMLLVEDDLFTQKLVGNSLSKYGTVHSAEDGCGAVMLYAKKAPDLLFLDIGLPDISGHKVLRKILKMDAGAYVVMLSGHGDRENVMKAMKMGARGFIAKPFTKDKLDQYVAKAQHFWAKNTQETPYANV